MTAILFVILGAAIAYFLMTSKSQSKEAMQAAPVGDNISQLVHYKRRIFQTSAYEEESTYQAIYYRIAQLTEDQISKHNNKLISAEAEREIRENFEKYFEVEAGCWRVKRILQLEDVPAGVLLGIAIQSLWGNKKYTAMKIEQNRFFANRAIEFLVVVKKYEPAILAKGFVLLYGFQEYLSPQVVQAKALLGVHLLDEPQMEAWENSRCFDHSLRSICQVCQTISGSARP